MKIKRVNELNKTKIFDDHFELLNHGEKYIENLYTKTTTKWSKTFNSIVQDDASYRHTAYQIQHLIETIEKEEKNIENFTEDIRTHLDKLDEIFKLNQKLPEEDDQAYEDLDNLKDRFGKMEDQITEYKNELKSVSESYLNIDDKMSYLRKFQFNLPI